MAILQKDKTDGIFKAAQTAPVGRNLSAEQGFVQKWAGQGGRLPTSEEINASVYGTQTPQFTTTQGSKRLPILGKITQQAQPQTPQQDPLTIFSENIISMLKEAQGTAGNEDLYARQRALQRQSIQSILEVTPEDLRGLSPEQQNALRSSTAKQVEPELDAIAATIKANDSRLTHFEGILGQMRDIGADFVKNLAPSPEIIDGYKLNVTIT